MGETSDNQIVLDHQTIRDLLSNQHVKIEGLTININPNIPSSKKPTYKEQKQQPETKEKESKKEDTKKETLKIPAKSRYVAAFLACALGRFGIHKFYLKKPALGVIYLFLSMTPIPFFLGIFEGVIYLLTDKETWMKQVGYIEL